MKTAVSSRRSIPLLCNPQKSNIRRERSMKQLQGVGASSGIAFGPIHFYRHGTTGDFDKTFGDGQSQSISFCGSGFITTDKPLYNIFTRKIHFITGNIFNHKP